MAFPPDIQQYLDLLNQITDQTFADQLTQGQKYITEHFAARGLGASGSIQQALQEFSTKHASASALAKTRNAAIAWQLSSARTTQQQAINASREDRDYYEKQDYSAANWASVQDAMDRASRWFNESGGGGRAGNDLPGQYSNYPDNYFSDPRSNYYTGGGALSSATQAGGFTPYPNTGALGSAFDAVSNTRIYPYTGDQ